MSINADGLNRLIGLELDRVNDARIVSHIRSLLIQPYLIMRGWDYGAPGQEYACWMVLHDPETGVEIGYSEYGFGPKFPWGLVGSGKGQTMGMDSGWFSTFIDAYFDSFACTTMPIWRVLKVSPDGAATPLTAEGEWDATWREVMERRESDPVTRYDCGHTISGSDR